MDTFLTDAMWVGGGWLELEIRRRARPEESERPRKAETRREQQLRVKKSAECRGFLLEYLRASSSSKLLGLLVRARRASESLGELHDVA